MFVFIEFLCLEKCRGKTRKYNKATHQLNGRRDSAITLSTTPLDFDLWLCLRMGRAANLLWNNMLEPVGHKTTIGLDHVMQRFYCPTEQAPYIFTYNNSIQFLQTGRQD
ncbi:hypothetical protein J6590_062083 [Homalodisca vitripennis]|nr:hypothetical protein J6590_062083 [Homalodisca vitripennis]